MVRSYLQPWIRQAICLWLALVAQLRAGLEELHGTGVEVALIRQLWHLLGNNFTSRVLIRRSDPVLAQLNLADDEIDCNADSIQIAPLEVPLHLHKLIHLGHLVAI